MPAGDNTQPGAKPAQPSNAAPSAPPEKGVGSSGYKPGMREPGELGIPVGPIIAVVVIALIAAGSYYFFFAHKAATTTTTSTSVSTSSSINSTTTLPAGVNTSTSTIAYAGSCLSTNATASVPNGLFANGTYAGWQTTGSGFGTAPLNISYANAHHGYSSEPWTGWNGYAATTYTGGPVSQGNITSSMFEVTEPYLDFKIISPKDTNLYIELLHGGSEVFKAFYSDFGSGVSQGSVFQNATLSLAPLICENVSVRVVAQEPGVLEGPNPYIAVTDFYLANQQSYNASQPWNLSFS